MRENWFGQMVPINSTRVYISRTGSHLDAEPKNSKPTDAKSEDN